MTGEEIRLEVNARLGKAIGVDAMNDEITEALRKISPLAMWPDLHAVDSSTLAFTSGLKLKALPTDFRLFDRAYVSADYTLVAERPDILRGFQEQASPASGDPEFQAIMARSMYVYPIPDSSITITLEYYKRPAVIADESLDLVFGDEFKEAVICWTIVQQLKFEGMSNHPKQVENIGLFNDQMIILRPDANTKPRVLKPSRYGQ